MDNIDSQDTSNCASIPQRQFDLWGDCYMIENTDSLNLGNMGLTGNISPEIGNLINLEYLFLHGNELTGEIPEEIGNLVNLKYLYLYDNELTGQIPSSIGGLSSLTQLFLYGNNISGTIPNSIGELTGLKKLFLYDNQLTGELPVEMNDLLDLEYVYINDNQLSGNIDVNFCDLNLDWSNSLYFNISNNQFCSPYPICLDNYMGYQDTMSCGNILSTLEQDINTYKVFNAYPNPFNPITTLSYYLPNSAQVTIIIYDIYGRVINNFFNGFQESGHRSITWYAKNDSGRPVSAGVYFLTIETGDFTDTKKMVLLK